MSREDQYKSKTMKRLEEKVGFTFREEDLFSEVRREIKSLSHMVRFLG